MLKQKKAAGGYDHAAERRRRDLAKIHMAIKRLGMDDATYRGMLWNVAGVKSAADLDEAGLMAVLDHLISRGFEPGRGKNPYPNTPHNLQGTTRSPQLLKVEAILADARLPWAYADGIARRMHNVDKVAWCYPGQLQGVIAALEKMVARKREKLRKIA